MRSAAGACDDHLEPAAGRTLGVGRHSLGRAVRGNDSALMRNAERAQGLRCGLEGGPVRLASHDEADERLLAGHASLMVGGQITRKEAAHYRGAKPMEKPRRRSN